MIRETSDWVVGIRQKCLSAARAGCHAVAVPGSGLFRCTKARGIGMITIEAQRHGERPSVLNSPRLCASAVWQSSLVGQADSM